MRTTLLRFILSLFILVLGVYLGMSYIVLKYSLDRPALEEQTIPLSTLIKSGKVQIAPDKFKCKDGTDKSVGAVVSSIFLSIQNDKEKRLTYSCSKNQTTSTTSCTLEDRCGLLQPSECKHLTLGFDADKEDIIKENTFWCRDQ